MTIARMFAGIGLLIQIAFHAAPAAAQDRLKIGIPTATAGWSFQDASGQNVGIVVDLVRALEPSIGAADLIPTPFAQLIPDLTAGKIDLIAGNLTVTAEREKLVSFSRPFFVGADGLVVATSNTKPIRTWDDLKGNIVGTFAGSIYVEPMRSSNVFSEVKTYASPDELVAAVDTGTINGAIGPGVSLGFLVSQGKYKNVRFVRTYEPKFKSNIALAVRKEDRVLLNRVDEALAKAQTEGAVKVIFTRWGQ